MFTQDDTIHFSCTQCGKCCQQSPEMHFFDMISLSDEFIFQTAHHAIISYEKQPLEKVLLEHYRAIAHTIVMPELDASMFYFINFMPVALASYQNCSKLDNNLCSIYGKRPSSCRMAPLDARYDDTQQWRTLNYFKDNVVKNDWQCNFTPQSPVIFENNMIAQPNLNSLYFQSVDSIREFTDKYIDFLALGTNNHQNEHFKAVFQSVVKNNLMISDMIIPLQVGIYHGILTHDMAKKFIYDQIALIDKEMAKSVTLKRKEDLKTTRLYKKQKEDYLKAIKAGFFDETAEHNDFME